ncbi:MAG: PilZ domain-containing protein [Magnetococcales bacterium]|nr:PilZ domain-containing protein [Magnetococcales bacterium]
MNGNREKERYTHNKSLKLEIDEERQFYGSSRDVSLTGLFFVPEEAGPDVMIGEKGTLQLTSGDEVHLFSCQVVRKTAEGLALQITDHPAKFGMAISHDVFHGLLNKMRVKEKGT